MLGDKLHHLTRMHSTRMRTVRCSGRRGGVCLGGVCPGGGRCLSVQMGVSVRGCLPRGCVSQHAMGQTPPDRILDTRL